MMGIALLGILVFIAIYVIKKKRYEKTEYYQQTKNAYLKVCFDKGLLGEFCTYKCLNALDGHKRYLFNVYIPKDDGETTELDVVLLHGSGIYVLESKNYSGWIFGTETQKYWTQTLPAGKGRAEKNRFYNPILQNKGHLKWIRAFLGDETLPFYSFIVFSDRCTLKNITLTSEQNCVINRYDLLAAVRQNVEKVGMKLSPDKIDALFQKLYPLTQVGEAEKMMHIKNVQQKQRADAPPVSATPLVTDAPLKTICPHCGGELIMRVAARGSRQGKKFLGCSNYPKCRYIENIPDEHKEED